MSCAALAGFAAATSVWMLVPLSVLGGIGNGYTASCLSTLLMARTPDSARGRVSATTNAIIGGAQGASLLLGGVVALALSPREIYGGAGLLGLAAAGIVALLRTGRLTNRDARRWNDRGEALQADRPGRKAGSLRERRERSEGIGGTSSTAASTALRRCAGWRKGHIVRWRVFFADEATAIAAGYRPCAVCMREEYRAWKAAQPSR